MAITAADYNKFQFLVQQATDSWHLETRDAHFVLRPRDAMKKEFRLADDSSFCFTTLEGVVGFIGGFDNGMLFMRIHLENTKKSIKKLPVKGKTRRPNAR